MSRRSAPLVQLTDEELLLLGAEHPVVDSPYLRTLSPEQREVAARVAYRSLCSHGALALDGGSGLELPESYVTMLQVRAAATTVLVVSRATVEAGVMRYHHLGGDTVVLEDVSDAGAHEFRVIPRAQLEESIRSFCTIEEAADGAGDTVTLTEESFAGGGIARRLWGVGLAQLDATVWRADATGEAAPVLGYLLGTTGSWSVRRTAPGTGDDAVVHLTPIRTCEVPEAILAAVDAGKGVGGRALEWPLMRA